MHVRSSPGTMDDERRDRTLWVGSLHPEVTEDHLYELFLQAGPLDDVKIPKDNNGQNKNFAFVTFTHAVSVGYSMALMGGVSLFGRKLIMQRRPNATVDDTYIDIMNNFIAHRKAQANGAQAPTQRPEANFTGHPNEAGASVVGSQWAGLPWSAPGWPEPLWAASAGAGPSSREAQYSEANLTGRPNEVRESLTGPSSSEARNSEANLTGRPNEAWASIGGPPWAGRSSSEARESEANLTGRPYEAWAYAPKLMWPPKPPEWCRPPSTSSQAPMTARGRHFSHGYGRGFSGNVYDRGATHGHHFDHGRSQGFSGYSCDRTDDRSGAFDYHERNVGGFRAGKDHPGIRNQYRDAPGPDRRFEESNYRNFGAPRGRPEEMEYRTQECRGRKRRY